MAIGNCLMGHIDSPDCMALGWLGSGGVDQFVGYTVVTWYGKMGWGVNSYLFDPPGRYDLAEAFYFSNQSLLHELAEKYPKSARLDLPLPEGDGGNPDKTIEDFQAALAAQSGVKITEDHLGLMWDRDVVAFYGDPLWDARLVPRGPTVHTAVTHEGSSYTFTASADGNVKLEKPLAMLLPHRLVNVHDVRSVDPAVRPLVTGNFAMLFGLSRLEAAMFTR